MAIQDLGAEGSLMRAIKGEGDTALERWVPLQFGAAHRIDQEAVDEEFASRAKLKRLGARDRRSEGNGESQP